MLVAGINPNSSVSRRRSGIASPRRPGCEQTWPHSLLPPKSETQACQDAEEAHGMFEDLSARSKLDGEEIAQLKKERDELLQRNVAANEKAGEVLKELEMERDFRRKAKSRAMAL